MQTWKTGKRKHPRVGDKDPRRPVAKARFFQFSDPQKRFQGGQVLDVSLGGLSLLIPEQVPVGSIVEIHVEPPPTEGAGGEITLGGAYRLLATVRWSALSWQDNYIHGVEFMDISLAEVRNRRGLEKIMEVYEQRYGSA